MRRAPGRPTEPPYARGAVQGVFRDTPWRASSVRRLTAAASEELQSPETLIDSMRPGWQRTNTSMGLQHTGQSSK